MTDFQTVTVNIEGMTCAGCEEHVNLELSKIFGVLESVTLYDAGNTIVKFDPTKTRIDSIYEAVKKAGYEPTSAKDQKCSEKSCCKQ